ncbi:hypothetical protein [uncultured Maribacter sp.]|uniref:hypothetical protein n=1 Tax=uncultured Maribacter sp. TaxID=431308 RepID=UPI0026235F0E|nr:hypothetical protein [uncultured Maribacter sp.]
MDTFSSLLENTTLIKMVKLIAWILFIVFIISFVRKTLKKRIEDVSIRYKAQKSVEIVGYVLIIFLVLMAFTVDSFKDYTIIIGLFTAGITFTLQELILSIAGFFIFFSFAYINLVIVLKSII